MERKERRGEKEMDEERHKKKECDRDGQKIVCMRDKENRSERQNI